MFKNFIWWAQGIIFSPLFIRFGIEFPKMCKRKQEAELGFNYSFYDQTQYQKLTNIVWTVELITRKGESSIFMISQFLRSIQKKRKNSEIWCVNWEFMVVYRWIFVPILVSIFFLETLC